MASRAICSMVSGVVPVDPPTPALSNVTTRRVGGQRVDQRRVPVVQVPAEMLEQDQRHPVLAAAAGVTVCVVNAVGGTTASFGKLRISLSHGWSPFSPRRLEFRACAACAPAPRQGTALVITLATGQLDRGGASQIVRR